MCDDFMFSPMDSAGEDRLRRVRACIRKKYGTAGRAPKRTLDMSAASSPAKMPLAKLQRRIEQASLVSAEQIFAQQFGSSEELLRTEFDLARPARYPATPRQAVASKQQPAGGAPTSYFSLAPPAFTSALPAPSTANVSQLARPNRIRTPRKAAIKRARTGESSAEKELVLRKPRLDGRAVHFSRGTSALDANPFAFVTTRGEQPKQPSRFVRKSPSKFQFSTHATRLFSQRQTPLR